MLKTMGHFNFPLGSNVELGNDTPMEMLTGKKMMKVSTGTFGQLRQPDSNTMQQF
jgi:hypothetical protein